MLWQNRQNENQCESDVNMAPLIDVSLVLVVILLLATPLAFESSIGVKNHDNSGKAADRDIDTARVEILLLDELNVRVNKTVMERAQLMSTLQPLLDQTSDRIVVIACNEGISHGAFVDVLDKAKLSGAASIAVTGR
jgi:biopolymer transport protein ExbD